jgi:hypothetical protein
VPPPIPADARRPRRIPCATPPPIAPPAAALDFELDVTFVEDGSLGLDLELDVAFVEDGDGWFETCAPRPPRAPTDAERAERLTHVETMFFADGDAMETETAAIHAEPARIDDEPVRIAEEPRIDDEEALAAAIASPWSRATRRLRRLFCR